MKTRAGKTESSSEIYLLFFFLFSFFLVVDHTAKHSLCEINNRCINYIFFIIRTAYPRMNKNKNKNKSAIPHINCLILPSQIFFFVQIEIYSKFCKAASNVCGLQNPSKTSFSLARLNNPEFKLNFQLPQSRKLFSGRFINAVHLVHAPIIAEQNDLQRVLYPLSVLVAPSTDRQTLIFFLFFFKKKDVSRCLGAHGKQLFRSHY